MLYPQNVLCKSNGKCKTKATVDLHKIKRPESKPITTENHQLTKNGSKSG